MDMFTAMQQKSLTILYDQFLSNFLLALNLPSEYDDIDQSRENVFERKTQHES